MTRDLSELNKKAYAHMEDWRNRPLQDGKYPYVYVDGIYLHRNWGENLNRLFWQQLRSMETDIVRFLALPRV